MPGEGGSLDHEARFPSGAYCACERARNRTTFIFIQCTISKRWHVGRAIRLQRTVLQAGFHEAECAPNQRIVGRFRVLRAKAMQTGDGYAATRRIRVDVTLQMVTHGRHPAQWH